MIPLPTSLSLPKIVHSEFQNPWYGILTCVFIFLPSAQVVSALYGISLCVMFGVMWGFGIAGIGGIMIEVVVPHFNSAELFVFGWFLILLGGGTLLISGYKLALSGYKLALNPNDKRKKGSELQQSPDCSMMDTIQKAILYPILMAFSPIISVVIKLLTIVSNSKLIQNMEKVSSEGEFLFESTPQLVLQLYIVLSKLTFDSWRTWFSITTSCLSLLVSLVHSQYVGTLPEHSWRDYVKSAIVILPNMIFRILSFR